jgi:alpha-L-rhamnosidase
LIEVEVPVNTKARICIPCSDIARIKENGQPVEGNPDVDFVGIKDDRVVLEAGSGRYHFVCNL